MLCKTKRNNRRKSATRGSLYLESLEGRKLLAAAILDTVTMDSGDASPSIEAYISPSTSVIGDGDSVAYIVNGQQTTSFDSVGIVNGGCTGTLISPMHVLTAAHCVEDAGGFIGDRDGSFRVNGQTYNTIKVTPQITS